MQDNPRYHRQIYRVDRVLFVERLSELTLIVPSLESLTGSHQGSVARTKKPTCRVSGSTFSFTRLATNSRDEQSTRITSCPNR